MNSRHGDIPDTLCCNYLSRLVDKLFKILPLKESNSDTIDTYLDDLIFEIGGNHSLMCDTNYNPKIMDIMCILESVRQEDMTHSEYRRAIFKCISISNQLNEYLKEEVDRRES